MIHKFKWVSDLREVAKYLKDRKELRYNRLINELFLSWPAASEVGFTYCLMAIPRPHKIDVTTIVMITAKNRSGKVYISPTLLAASLTATWHWSRACSLDSRSNRSVVLLWVTWHFRRSSVVSKILVDSWPFSKVHPFCSETKKRNRNVKLVKLRCCRKLSSYFWGHYCYT